MRVPPPQFTVHVDDRGPLVRIARTTMSYTSSEEVLPVHEAVARILDDIGRAGRALLVDLREAPPNNDPGFERAIRRGSAQILHGFARMALLVRTAVGALHVARMLREAGLDVPMFQDEGAALAYLLSGRRYASSNPPPGSRDSRPSSTPPAPTSPRGRRSRS